MDLQPASTHSPNLCINQESPNFTKGRPVASIFNSVPSPVERSVPMILSYIALIIFF